MIGASLSTVGALHAEICAMLCETHANDGALGAFAADMGPPLTLLGALQGLWCAILAHEDATDGRMRANLGRQSVLLARYAAMMARECAIAGGMSTFQRLLGDVHGLLRRRRGRCGCFYYKLDVSERVSRTDTTEYVACCKEKGTCG
jgi:hypothetical protein